MEQFIIDTPCGKIQGTACEGGTVYKGIRYATAQRWHYPEIVTHWDGVYRAEHFGNCSYQPRCFQDEWAVPEKAFYAREFREGETYQYSEDCLFLNIWVPEGAKKAPVLFYIHGGGFTGGCGHEKHFSGEAYCKEGVITVTINYRLGPLGFFCLPELKERDGRTGNYGLFDQLTALRWIYNNISAFGGDASRITLMGQSAGAMSVQLLCCSPLTKELMAGAVMLSGGGVSKMLNTSQSPEECFEAGKAFLRESEAKSFEELEQLSPEKLFETFSRFKKNHKKAANVLAPVVDGVLLECSSLEVAEKGEHRNIPYLLGSTSEDIVPPIVHKMAVDWALLQEKQGKCPSYVYFFNRQLPGDDKGAWHSSDLWYTFGTWKRCWRPFEERDEILSEAMVKYLAAFIKTGSPDAQGLPKWYPVTKHQKKVMCFGDSGYKMGRPNRWKLLWRLTKKAVGE